MEGRTKQCSKCKRILPVSEFYKNKTRKDGLATMCKDCAKEYRNLKKGAVQKRKKGK